MAVSENDLVVGPLTPAAGVTTISLDFYFEQASWLEVYKAGSETPLVLNTDYTVAGAGGSSGVVTLTTAANGTDAYSIYLAVPLQRSSDMQLRGEFKSEPFNIEMDRIWQSLQRQNTLLSRTARLRMTATYPAPLLPVEPETGKALVWNADGNLINAALDTGDIAVDVAAAAAARAGAETAQSAAETAQGLAEDAQTGAETAQGLAETAQAGAETAETNAEAAQAAAEAARDAAFVNADVYADIATGRAAVADGEQFMVVSADGLEIIRYERTSSTTQDEVARYPSKSFTDSLSFFPNRTGWSAVEIAALPRIESLVLFGADQTKHYGVKYLFWKDVGTRFNLTIYEADDDSGTSAADAATYLVASGADVWTGRREISLVQTGGSGITGTAVIDFTDTAAMAVNAAPSTAATYQRRELANVSVGSTARTADIGAQAEAQIPIRKSGSTNLFMVGGNGTLTGARNTGLGYLAADALTDGNDNTAFGYNALSGVTGGDYNTGVGSGVMPAATGDGNAAVGYAALPLLTTATQNAAIGFQAGYGLTSGGYNVALGSRALFSSTTALFNVAIGYNALFANTATGNVGIGESAAFGVTSAANLTAVGRRAAYTKTTGNDCSFFGHQAGFSGLAGEVNTGEGNTQIGAYSGGHNTTGAYNTGVGRASLWYGSAGSNNFGGGFRAGYGNTVGNDNVSLGFYSRHNLNTGSKHTFLGARTDGYIPALGSMAGAAVAGSGLEIGVYGYRVAFVIDGVETAVSEPMPAVTTTSGNQQIDLTGIPTYSGPRTCSARKIYRTKVGGENLLYLTGTLADNTTTTLSDTTADASLSTIPVAFDGSIALGYGATVFDEKQFVVGSELARITEVIIGGGIDDPVPEAVTVGSSNASGTNVDGADLRLRPGTSTGSGKPGDLILSAAKAGANGTGHNASVDWITLDGRGFLNIKETTSADVPTPAAGSVNLFVESGALKFRDSGGVILTVATS